MGITRLSITLSLCMLIAACNTIGDSVGNMGYRTFSIKGSNIGIQYVPNQITRVLEDEMGYQRLKVEEVVPEYTDTSDTSTRVSGMLIESVVDYRMVFRSQELPSLLVRVRIIKSTGGIHVGVLEGKSRDLSPRGRAKVDELVATFANLYGPENVKYRG